MQILFLFFAFVFLLIVFTVFAAIASKFRVINKWGQSYRKLSKRYGGDSAGSKRTAASFVTGFGIKKPSLYFNYGRTFCRLRNRKRLEFSNGRSTEMSMNWPDRKLRLVISTSRQQNLMPTKSALFRQVFIDQPEFQSNFYVSSTRPHVAKRMLNGSVQWQIEQLRRHLREREVLIKIERGNLLVAKPGYIKRYQDLEDFVRFSLNLFDQLMLLDVEGIEFVNENQASVVSDVKCPICSEEIIHEMVVCTRCKTPHCRDCWQYNGQCATFACAETRFISTGEVQV